MAVRIALHDIGAPFEARPISFARCKQHAPDYPAPGPEGDAPILLVGARPLAEAAAIPFRLARAFSGKV